MEKLTVTSRDVSQWDHADAKTDKVVTNSENIVWATLPQPEGDEVYSCSLQQQLLNATCVNQCEQNFNCSSSISLNTDSESDTLDTQEEVTARVRIFRTVHSGNLERKFPQNGLDIITETGELFCFTRAWLRCRRKQQLVDYITDVLNLCAMYSNFAFFGDNIKRRYTALRLRANALDVLCYVLSFENPKCVLHTGVKLARDLASAQLVIMRSNMERRPLSEEPTDTHPNIMEDPHLQKQTLYGFQAEIKSLNSKCSSGVLSSLYQGLLLQNMTESTNNVSTETWNTDILSDLPFISHS